MTGEILWNIMSGGPFKFSLLHANILSLDNLDYLLNTWPALLDGKRKEILILGKCWRPYNSLCQWVSQSVILHRFTKIDSQTRNNVINKLLTFHLDSQIFCFWDWLRKRRVCQRQDIQMSFKIVIHLHLLDIKVDSSSFE